MPLTAIPINCTLKRSGGKRSSTDAMIAVLIDRAPEKVDQQAKMVASNAAHLAGLLQGSAYPGT